MFKGLAAGLRGAFLLLVAVQPAMGETLMSAVERGIRHQPEVRAYGFESKAAVAGIDAAKGGRLPRVSVSADVGNDQPETLDFNDTRFSLTMTQPLYDGGETSSSISRSQAEADAAKRRFDDALAENALKVVQAYIEVQRSRRVLKVMKVNLAELHSIERRVAKRAAAGFASAAEASQAASEVEGGREQVITAEQQLADAVTDYRTMTGSEPGDLETGDAPVSALPPNVDIAVARAKQRSPRILALKYDALAAAAAAESAASAFSPKVSIRLSLDYDGYEWNSDARTKTTTAMLSLRYDLYDGGVRAAREKQARLRAEASKQDALIAAQEAENEIRKSWTAVSASAARCEPLLRRAAAARKALKLNSERFSAGKASLDTLLSLQNDAASSEIAYLNELSASRYHVYRLLAATGTLLPALGLRFSSIDSLR